MSKTKIPEVHAPKGGKIVHVSGLKYEFSWKQGSSYDKGQWIKFGLNYSGLWWWTDYAKIGTNTTSKTHTFKGTFYPENDTKLKGVACKVYGKKEVSWKESGKTKKKVVTSDTYTFKELFETPNKPRLSSALASDVDHTAIFTWDKPSKIDTTHQFYDFLVLYLENASGSSKPEDVASGWKYYKTSGGTGSNKHGVQSAGSKAITAVNVSSGSKMVAIKAGVRSRSGFSGWVYKSVVFTDVPKQATGLTINPGTKNQDDPTKISHTPDGYGWQFNVRWNAPTSRAQPLDYISIMYCIGIPRAGLAAPAPSEGSWTEHRKLKDVLSTDTTLIRVESALNDDECIFARVDTYYQNDKTLGKAVLAKLGTLAAPNGISISEPLSSNRFTLTATNNSQVPDSFLAISYHDDSDSKDNGKIIGIIEHGQSSVTFKCPDYEGKEIGFGVRAYAGTTYYSTKRDDGVSVYTILNYDDSKDGIFTENPISGGGTQYWYVFALPTYSAEEFSNLKVVKTQILMTKNGETVELDKSEYSVPRPFQALVFRVIDFTDAYNKYTAEGYTFTGAKIFYTIRPNAITNGMSSKLVMGEADIPKAPQHVTTVPLNDGVQVSWDTTWEEADGAEVSWSDQADAWISTNPPSTYETNNLRDSVLNVKDVALGATWYFKVRNFKTNTSGNNIYSPYGEAEPLDLSSVPNKPTLELTNNVITDRGSTVAFWTFSSDDYSDQASATLYEVYNTQSKEEALRFTQFLVSDDKYTAQLSFAPTDFSQIQAYAHYNEPNQINVSSYISVVYTLTENTTVDPSKRYYSKNGDVYTLVTPDGSENPSEEGWYEDNNTISISLSSAQDLVNEQISLGYNDDFIDYDFDSTGMTLTPIYLIYQSEGSRDEVPILDVKTEQRVQLSAENRDWYENTTHQIAVRVKSETGKESELSDPVELRIAAPLICKIEETSLEYEETFEGKVAYGPGSTLTIPGVLDTDIRSIFNLTVSMPYSENGYTDIVVKVNDEEYNISWGHRYGAIYEGTYNILTGVLTSTKDSTGSVYSEPRVYNIQKYDPDLVENDNTITAYYQDPEDSEQTISLNVEAETVETFKRANYLTSMPLEYTATGAGTSANVYAYISRATDYTMARPDGTSITGHAGETVYSNSYIGEAKQTVNLDDLMGYLDDGADYTLTVVISNDIGQQDYASIDFTVKWNHQAIMPEGTVTIEDGVAKIHTMAAVQDETETGDHIDIYRLSGDSPHLIFQNAEFDHTYVDPYPTIGSRGGYRLVYVTNNGDYIAPIPDSDGGEEIAWYDITEDASINTPFQLLDFGGETIEFKYNVKIDNSWDKRFTKTQYLDGAVQGDWDIGTDKTQSLSGITFDDLEPEVYDAFRRLAEYSGICHVRTIEGSNYTANVNVKDSSTFNSLEHQHDISLDITRVDDPEMDAMPLEKWEEEQEEEESENE